MMRECRYNLISIYEKRPAMFIKRWKYFGEGVPLNSEGEKKELEEQVMTVSGREANEKNELCVGNPPDPINQFSLTGK